MMLGNGPTRQPLTERMFGRVRTLGQTLAWTECLGPEELPACRMPHLSAFLTYARDNVPFYKGRLDFDLKSPQAIRNAWPNIPILTRQDSDLPRIKPIGQFYPPLKPAPVSATR